MNTEEKSARFAKTSMILGIVGLIIWLFPFLGFPASITGLVLGLRAFDSPKKGMAIAGIVLCVIGISFSSVNAGIGCYMGSTGQHNLVNSILGEMTGEQRQQDDMQTRDKVKAP